MSRVKLGAHLLAISAIVAGVAACNGEPEQDVATGFTAATDFAAQKTCAPVADTPVHIKAGSFAMGQDAIYAEEGPIRQTRVNAFWIDPHEVTNRQFAEFVAATSYVTVAEKPVDPGLFNVPADHIPPDMLKPGSAVFTPPKTQSNHYYDWWEYLPGASWRKPYGPNGPDAQENQPVVHLAWPDMIAYADWRGGRFRQRRNGNMPPAPVAPKPLSSPPPMRRTVGKAPSLCRMTVATGSRVLPRLAVSSPTALACMTWLAMCGR